MNDEKQLKIQMRRFPEVFNELSGVAGSRCEGMTSIGRYKLSHLKHRKAMGKLCMSLEYYRARLGSPTRKKGGELHGGQS
jgi:hypothetical protein